MTDRHLIKQAVVIGSGQMGPGIAYTLASAGCNVSIYARSLESVERGVQAFHAAVDILAGADCISADEAADIRTKISGTTQFEPAVGSADLVVESISEDLEMKQKLFAHVEKKCRPEAILTSNTSGLPATELAGLLNHKNRFAVTHFWNPPHLMPLVEIVKGAETSQQTLDILTSIFRKAKKSPVVVLKDTPGQLGNRLFHALLREAIWMVQEGIATVEDVDTAIKNGFGRRFPVYGALEHQDVAGLDTVYAIQKYMCKALCSDTSPARFLEDKVNGGNLGVASGSGFYDWKKRDFQKVRKKRDAFLIELLKEEKAVLT